MHTKQVMFAEDIVHQAHNLFIYALEQVVEHLLNINTLIINH